MIICKDVHKFYPLGHGQKHVLKGINMTVGRGERIGLLGRNGSGKSTLIKLLGGVELPTSGRVERGMTLSWPLGFTGGFQGALTGYDNARFISRIYGREYTELRDFVEDFSELGVQLKMPVKTYSSGMRARLAFALSLAIEFECYLIDEVIMVGDQDFQRKCHYQLFDKRADRSLILASHSPEIIRSYCNRAVVLHEGTGTVFDDIDRALECYDML
ncbi:ABC transporter ATP-binding protein [Sphingobium nicotianae]|uniref:ABC transporter ATP-binding protein n=1 Tax=Sphingobium nicotianae TaxID=2782607 RepID=A0A9X1DCR4_9SPHN|nr:ABC transporter ATP-binding protein [Sphingobium nicotianae]MBT2187519.1 ABC transporter ATP-binding protein [Sphingobium nicotianae]